MMEKKSACICIFEIRCLLAVSIVLASCSIAICMDGDPSSDDAMARAILEQAGCRIVQGYISALSAEEGFDVEMVASEMGVAPDQIPRELVQRIMTNFSREFTVSETEANAIVHGQFDLEFLRGEIDSQISYLQSLDVVVPSLAEWIIEQFLEDHGDSNPVEGIELEFVHRFLSGLDPLAEGDVP